MGKRLRTAIPVLQIVTTYSLENITTALITIHDTGERARLIWINVASPGWNLRARDGQIHYALSGRLR
jgi:hypothetical protein